MNRTQKDNQKTSIDMNTHYSTVRKTLSTVGYKCLLCKNCRCPLAIPLHDEDGENLGDVLPASSIHDFPMDVGIVGTLFPTVVEASNHLVDHLATDITTIVDL